MANILDYLAWRGDLPFDRVPFGDVDGLILSRLAYMPFQGIVPASFQKEPVSVKQAAEICLALVQDKGSKRSFRLDSDELLLRGLIDSERFSGLSLTGHVNRFDAEKQEQFSATTVLLPGEGAVVAYRGTDGTIIGWKEDFNMGFADSVPAQQDAVDYLQEAAQHVPGNLRLLGHSKGGNLAVYAGAFCPLEVQERITGVCSHDGPGFNSHVTNREEFQRIIGRTRTFLPQSSVVGMLLEHEEDYTVVHSKNVGLMQHDVYSWEIVRGDFSKMDGLTNSSQFIDRTLKDWMENMTPALREKMIDGVFSVLGASEGVTLRDLWNGKNTIAVIRAFGDMDEQTRQLLGEAFSILRGSAKKAFPLLLDQYFDETRRREPEPRVK